MRRCSTNEVENVGMDYPACCPYHLSQARRECAKSFKEEMERIINA